MSTTVRVETVTDRVDALSLDFLRGVGSLLQEALPYESLCLGTLAPASRLITSAVTVNLPVERAGQFAMHEYRTDDVNSLLDLSFRPVPLAASSFGSRDETDRSRRWLELVVPHFDARHELRAVLKDGDQCWGTVSLYRAGVGSGFSPAETDFLARVAPLVARGIRAGLVSGVGRRADTRTAGPAVLVVDADGELLHASPAAVESLEVLERQAAGVLPTAVLTVVHAARAFAGGTARDVPRVRVRSRDGRWLLIHAAPLSDGAGATGQVAVTLEPAGPPDVLPLVVAALGLTGREQQVVQHVLRGDSTQQIATALFLSPHTVQDHVKSVFEKAAVNSRRELVGRVFFDHYSGNDAAGLGARGGFFPA